MKKETLLKIIAEDDCGLLTIKETDRRKYEIDSAVEKYNEMLDRGMDLEDIFKECLKSTN